MATLRVFRVLGQERLVPAPLLPLVRPCLLNQVVRKTTRCRHMVAAALSQTVTTEDHLKLHELVSQGRYCEAVDLWEKTKEEGVADSTLYTSVMQMAARVGGAEAVESVKDDMDRQGWIMDSRCSLYYLEGLVREGQVNEALQYIKSSHMKDDAAFLADCANLLVDTEHFEEALDVCTLLSTSSFPPPPPPPSSSSLTLTPAYVQLLTVQLETLGRLRRKREMSALFETITHDSRPEVQFALANGFSLAGQSSRAMSLLKSLRSQHKIPVKSLALLLESAQKEEKFELAAEAFSLFWNRSTLKPSDEDVMASPSCLPHHSTYHRRAVTAAIFLQAFAYRATANNSSNSSYGEGGISERMRSFMEREFFQELVHHRYPPTPDMYKALILLSCYHQPALSWADAVIKQCRAMGQTVPASFLTSWGHVSGTISPSQALKVLHMVRAHRHHYQLELDLSHYSDLLSIRYHCQDNLTSQKEALDCIRAIKNSMDTWGVLNSTEAYNLVLEAVVAIPAVGAHYTTYNDMSSAHVDPDLRTFHLILDGTLREGSVKNTKRAVYHLWRSLMKEWPRLRPDVELVNKFIECCVVCEDTERGLVFLSALGDCSADPNTQTFTLLLQLCHSTNQRESFDSVLKLAEHCLPDHAPQIRLTAHELERQWRAEEDFSLAESIISQLDTNR